MKKNWHKFLAATLVVFLVAGVIVWQLLQPEDEFKTLLIGGSSTVYPYAQALADHYETKRPGTNIHCVSGGSTPGLMAVANGAIDLATMSRDLTEDEDNQYLKNYLIGRDGIGIIVHPENPLQNLSVSQVQSILNGQVTDWSELDPAAERPIQVVSDALGSTAYSIVCDTLLLGDSLTGSAITASDAADVVEHVAKDPGAIGFVTLKDVSTSVKLLTVDGVPMTRETILSSRYPLIRSFYLVISLDNLTLSSSQKEKTPVDLLLDFFSLDSDRINELRQTSILDFIAYVRSADGQQVIEQLGAVAVY